VGKALRKLEKKLSAALSGPLERINLPKYRKILPLSNILAVS
jgi:hypothetical protein